MIALILRKVNWSGLSAVLGQLDLRWAALASVSTLALIAGLALRWRLFLRQQQIDLPYRTVFLLTWAGQFFNSVLPGSTGGDVVKLLQICRLAPDRKAAAASTVFVDRISALLALLALAGLSLVSDPRPLRLVPWADVPVSAALFAVAAAVVVGGAVLWLTFRFLRSTELWRRIIRTVGAARANLTLNGNVLAAVTLAFAVHLLNFFTIYLFARALGISLTYWQATLMMPVILFLVMVPITINGHGLREVLLIAYFGSMGVIVVGHPEIAVRETAVALSLVAVANDLLWSLLGGLLYATSFRPRRPVLVVQPDAPS